MAIDRDNLRKAAKARLTAKKNAGAILDTPAPNFTRRDTGKKTPTGGPNAPFVTNSRNVSKPNFEPRSTTSKTVADPNTPGVVQTITPRNTGKKGS